MQKFIALVETEAIGRVPMYNMIGLAKLKALGVCPCSILSVWQNWKHWACAQAEFCCFGRIKGIGRVSMQDFFLLAQPEALGVCPCRISSLWQN